MHVNTTESYICRVGKPRVYLMRLIHQFYYRAHYIMASWLWKLIIANL